MAAFTKMFTKRENKDWVNDVKIEADEEKSDDIEDNNNVQDVDCEEVDAFSDDSDSKPIIDHCEDEKNPKEKEVAKNSAIKNKERKDGASIENTNVQVTKDVNKNDITTAMKENQKLIDKIKALEEAIAQSEKENEKNIFCNNELKSILIGVGLSGKFEMFESLKIELKEKNIENEHLKTMVSENKSFVESLKNNLLLGMTQLFENTPQKTIAIQQNNEEITMIEERPIEINQIKEDAVVKKVMEMYRGDKTIIQIKHNTGLTIEEVKEIIEKEGGTLENVS